MVLFFFCQLFLGRLAKKNNDKEYKIRNMHKAYKAICRRLRLRMLHQVPCSVALFTAPVTGTAGTGARKIVL